MDNSTFRLLIFSSILLFFIFIETSCSYRKRNLSRRDRWFGNFGMIVLGNALVKLVFPLGLIPFSVFFQENDWGVFNLFKFNTYIEICITVILLDCAIYFQHVLSHKVPFLWRFHRVHHADIDLDVTSALRFHPLEILFSMGYKLFFVCLFGVGPEAIVVFEVILSSMAMFNHSNIHIPNKIESFLRLFVVTPQMHIIHHSIDQKESDMNFGFNLSIWDRVFKTYAKDFLCQKTIGLSYFRNKKEHSLLAILKLPFINK